MAVALTRRNLLSARISPASTNAAACRPGANALPTSHVLSHAEADSIGLVVAKVRRSNSGTPRNDRERLFHPFPQARCRVGIERSSQRTVVFRRFKASL